ncbi:DegV family protein [Collinsella sp. zg1085]|uniref:DegV family protein n=1 Tax=Collinsella sp. zg1085 TaxID=2844380 RepID=UPI001C0B321D|nr:DegV family protein [Collinsella sp. zg1085]QWT17174.1 DegV family protein [Collinsella sp. zg1085]
MTMHIITDSASDIPAGTHDKLTILPLSIAFGTAIYQDGVDLSVERFYDLLIEGDHLPTTGQVNPFAYSQAIEQARATGADEIVIITLSSKLSGTHESACIAAHEAGGTSAGIYVLDSKQATIGEGILVEYALRLRDAGMTAPELVGELEAARGRICTLGLLDTLEFLRRGGRVPAAAAALGELLSIKPVIGVRDGEVVMLGRARGSKNGRNLLNREITTAGGVDFSMPLCLGYSGQSDHLLQKYIDDSAMLWEQALRREELPIVQVGATIGTHTGPGAIALACFTLG